MVWPYQLPLYAAIEALERKDFEGAEASVDSFFNLLENDAMAKECRRQHFDRQVFEADFFSILTKEEIDAWAILATVKLQREDFEGAQKDCYRQIELIDQYYGFDTPSWETPELRIPLNPELIDRYNRIARHLSFICAQLNDDETSQRWLNVSNTLGSDRAQPDEVWTRWISSDDHSQNIDSEIGAVGITIFEFSDWDIQTLEIDDCKWLINLSSTLFERASPLKENWLVKISISTDPNFEIPSKAIRWRIWSLRQAVTARLMRNGAGVYFGELQKRGERVLLYYATGENEALDALGKIFEAARELNPVIDISHDPKWKEYEKWGGNPVLDGAPHSVPMPESDANESINDYCLREVWKLSEQVHEGSSRFYLLVNVLNSVPPQTEEWKNFCLNSLIDLLEQLHGKDQLFCLLQMTWKLPAVDSDSAIEAFDALWRLRENLTDETTFCLAIEELAKVEPDRALMAFDWLMQRNYSLVSGGLSTVINSYSETDPEKAKQLLDRTIEYLKASDSSPHSISTSLLQLAERISEKLPEKARELLVESEQFAQKIDLPQAKSQVYAELMAPVEKVAPELLPAFCSRAISAAYDLQVPDPDQWMDFRSPTLASIFLTLLIPSVAKYDAAASCDLSFSTLKIIEQIDDVSSRLRSLARLAESAVSLNPAINEAFSERLWRTAMDTLKVGYLSPDSFFMSRDYCSERNNPIDFFVAMNPKLAARKIDVILEMCKSAILPEREVALLCRFAALLSEVSPQICSTLLERAHVVAQTCSSIFLKSISLCQIAATYSALGTNSDAAYAEAQDAIRTVQPNENRFEALMKAGGIFNKTKPELSAQLFDEAAVLSASLKLNPQSTLVLLEELPVRTSSRLFFYFLRSQPVVHNLDVTISHWANRFASESSSTNLGGA